MKYVMVEKMNVAWFKLAEFVGRKEKERALGVYRLLSHSLSDTAFAAQLEGDLLMAFQDEKALDAYQKAAHLYEKSGNLMHAALLYEHMVMLSPDNKDYFICALKLYELMKNEAKIARCAGQLARLLIKQQSFDALTILMSELVCAQEHRLYVQQWCALGLIEFQPDQETLIHEYLYHIINSLELDTQNPKRLTIFLAKISALNSQWYQKAYQYLKLEKEITA